MPNLPTTQALLKFIGKRRAAMIEEISRETEADHLFDIMLYRPYEDSEGSSCIIASMDESDTQADYLRYIRDRFDDMELIDPDVWDSRH